MRGSARKSRPSAVADGEEDTDSDAVDDADSAEADGVADSDAETDGVADSDAETDSVADSDAETDGVADSDAETDSVTDGDADGDAETDGVADGGDDGDAKTAGVVAGDAKTDGVTDGDAEVVGVTLRPVVGDAESDGDGVDDVDGEYSPKQDDGIAATLLKLVLHEGLIALFIMKKNSVRLGFAAVVKTPVGSKVMVLHMAMLSVCNFDKLAKIDTGRPQPSIGLPVNSSVFRFGVLSNSPAGKYCSLLFAKLMDSSSRKDANRLAGTEEDSRELKARDIVLMLGQQPAQLMGEAVAAPVTLQHVVEELHACAPRAGHAAGASSRARAAEWAAAAASAAEHRSTKMGRIALPESMKKGRRSAVAQEKCA